MIKQKKRIKIVLIFLVLPASYIMPKADEIQNTENRLRGQKEAPSVNSNSNLLESNQVMEPTNPEEKEDLLSANDKKREVHYGFTTAFNMINWSDHHRFSRMFINPFLAIDEEHTFMKLSIRFTEKSRSWDDLASQDYGKSYSFEEGIGGLKNESGVHKFYFALGFGKIQSEYGSHFLPVLYLSPVLPQEIYVPPNYFNDPLYYKGGFIEYNYVKYHFRIIWDMEFYSSPRPEFKTIWIENELKKFGPRNFQNSVLLQTSASGFNILDPREAGNVKLDPSYGIGLEYALRLYQVFQVYAGAGSSDENNQLYHSGFRIFGPGEFEISTEVQYNAQKYYLSDTYKKDPDLAVVLLETVDPGYEFYIDAKYQFFDVLNVTIFIDRHESRPWHFGIETRFKYSF